MSFNVRLRPTYLFLTLILSLTAGCATLPPVIRGPEAPTSAPAAVEPTLAPPTVAPPLSAPAVVPEPAASLTETLPLAVQPTAALTGTVPVEATPAMTAITGQVIYRQRIALTPDAVVEVELQDISHADAPPSVLGSETIETAGRQVPIPFSVQYDLSQIDPQGVYVLAARILEGGLMTWSSPESPRVITGGAPTDQVQIMLQQAVSPKVPDVTMGSLEGTVTYLQRIALPDDAVIEVSLQDVSRADAPAVVLATQTITANGRQVPIPFALEYDAAAIDPAMRYSLSARITRGDQLLWISTMMYPVLTHDAAVNNVEIVVEPVQQN
jgi:uncharacterized lipoprotein YbaY